MLDTRDVRYQTLVIWDEFGEIKSARKLYGEHMLNFCVTGWQFGALNFNSANENKRNEDIGDTPLFARVENIRLVQTFGQKQQQRGKHNWITMKIWNEQKVDEENRIQKLSKQAKQRKNPRNEKFQKCGPLAPANSSGKKRKFNICTRNKWERGRGRQCPKTVEQIAKKVTENKTNNMDGSCLNRIFQCPYICYFIVRTFSLKYAISKWM